MGESTEGVEGVDGVKDHDGSAPMEAYMSRLASVTATAVPTGPNISAAQTTDDGRKSPRERAPGPERDTRTRMRSPFESCSLWTHGEKRRHRP
ncbi:hypothetical protein QFZ49_004145 [Streptomyces turgidiscabies]|uniref:Uncharacterized protein n=1 Tax=Streptomyces turgidiscabies TaxID=85558 RepID=A0ABU0RQF4_9ACTN|nr:hypothetical protein [Streptomyces turgidiscabies]